MPGSKEGLAELSHCVKQNLTPKIKEKQRSEKFNSQICPPPQMGKPAALQLHGLAFLLLTYIDKLFSKEPEREGF